MPADNEMMMPHCYGNHSPQNAGTVPVNKIFVYNGREFFGDSDSYRGLYMYVHVCLSTDYITLIFLQFFLLLQAMVICGLSSFLLLRVTIMVICEIRARMSMCDDALQIYIAVLPKHCILLLSR